MSNRLSIWLVTLGMSSEPFSALEYVTLTVLWPVRADTVRRVSSGRNYTTTTFVHPNINKEHTEYINIYTCFCITLFMFADNFLLQCY